MKFSCDRCRAQYMISDEKVRPNGVKVRCKKCGHVIVVKRASAEVPVVAPAPAARVPFGTQVGADGLPRAGSLDEEIGAAFDTMVSDSPSPAAEPAPAAPAEEDPGRWLDELGSAADLAPEPEAEAPVAKTAPADTPPPDSDWFLAVDGEQVGPLRLAALSERWDRAEIGPDTLCWRSGMLEWTPLSQIAELAGVLAPLPRRPARPDPVGADHTAADRGPAEPEPWARPTPESTTADAGFRPTAASALASLVEKEVDAARKAEPEPAKEDDEPAAPAIETTGIRMLLRSLPDAPPAEPSKFIPLQRTAEAAPPAKSAAPAPAPGVPARRSKGVLVAVLSAIVFVPLAAAGAWFAFGARPELTPASESVLTRAERPAPEPPKPVVQAEPAKKDAPVEEPPAVAVAEEAAGEKAAETAGEAEGGDAGAGEKSAVADAKTSDAKPGDAKPGDDAKEEPAKHAEAPPAKEAPRKAEPARKADPPRPTRAARQEPVRAPEPTKPAEPPRRSTSSEDLLAAAHSSSIDDLFEKEFSGGKQAPASKPSATYIPPPPGAGNQLPAQLGQGDVTGVVVGHKSAIKSCVTEYKNVGGAESGTLVMRWTIEPNGTTSGIKPVKGAEHQKLATCVGGLIKGWKFPAYSGPRMAPIDFPFQF